MTAYSLMEEDIRLTDCGREDCSNLHAWGPGIRPCHIIHYIIRGSGYLETGHRRFPVSAGESFLTYPYTAMHYYPDPEDPWEYTWVNFVGKKVPLLLSESGFSPSAPVLPQMEAAHILPLYDRIRSLDIHVAGRWEAEGLLLALLGAYRDTLALPCQAQRKKEDDRLSTALLLIQSHYHKQDFHVEQLCQDMHINRVTLYRLFTDTFGTSPTHYISRYRLEQAKKLLGMGFAVKETASSCGFSDPFYFSRVFKAYTGISPSLYHRK